MAIGAIEMATVSRSQDYSAIKHNEDNKAVASQENGLYQVEKKEMKANREVNSGEKTGWNRNNPDARQQGKNQYSGDGGKKRKASSTEQVIVKSNRSNGFDIKI